MVVVAVSVASGSAFAVRLFSMLGPVGTLWLRNLIAGLVLLAVGARSFRRPSRGQAKWMLALGLALTICNLALYEALVRIPLGVATTVEFLGPLAIAVLGSKRAIDLVWAGLAAIGVALLGSPTTHVDPIGLGLALVAGASWAAYIVISKRLVHEVGPVLCLTMAFVVSALLLTPFGIAATGDSPPGGSPWHGGCWSLFSPQGCLVALR